MNLCLAAYAGYADEIQILDTLAFDVRHEIVELIQRHG